jgi:hypothetical protein
VCTLVDGSCALYALLCTNRQRRRETEALDSLDAWGVDLVEDEQWGYVLQAQRDFSPGEIVIQSGALLLGKSAAECLRMYRNIRKNDLCNYATIVRYIAKATKSLR